MNLSLPSKLYMESMGSVDRFIRTANSKYQRCGYIEVAVIERGHIKKCKECDSLAEKMERTVTRVYF